jgi:hypothetical protein
MNKNSLKLNIATPAGIFEGEFAKTMKVSELITTVVEAMNLAAGDLFNMVFQGEVLEPVQRPLVSFGLTDCSELELVATGSGVCVK